MLTVLAVYFTFFSFLGGASLTNPRLEVYFRVFHQVFITLLLSGWLIHLLIRQRPWPATPFDIPLLAFFAVTVTATVFALDPRISAEELWRLGTQILMLYAVIDLMRETRPRTVLEPLFFASAVVILIAAMEMSSWYFGVPRLPYFSQSWFSIGGFREPIPPVIHRLELTMLVPTFLSAYMAVLIPVGLAWMISSGSTTTRRGLFLWLIGAVIVEILSFSRGGLVSLAVSLPAFFVLLGIGSTSWRTRIFNAIHDRRVQIGLGMAGALALLLLLLWARQTNLGGHGAGDKARFDLWQAAWQIGLDDPVTGAGPYGFGRAMRPYIDPRTTRDGYTTPHNIPLLIWSEQGLPGVLALLAMVGAFFWTAYQRWRGAVGTEHIRVAGCLAAMLGFTVHNLFDTFIGVTPVMVVVMGLIAYLVAPLGSAINPAPRRARWAVAGVLLTLLLAQAGWIISGLAQSHFARAIGLMDRGHLAAALQEIDQARRLDPALGLYTAQRAQILGRLAAEDPSYIPSALRAYEATLSFDESYDLIHANYAGLLAHTGDFKSALVHMQRAAEIKPQVARYHLWLGRYAEELRQEDTARAAYREALTEEMSLTDSRYWAASTLRVETRDRFLQEQKLDVIPLRQLSELSPICWPYVPAQQLQQNWSLELRCGSEYALRLAGKNADVIGALDEAMDGAGSAYALRAEAYLAAGQFAAAERDARTALFLEEQRAYYLLGQIAEAAANFEAAETFYLQGSPLLSQSQDWDVAVYGRRGSLSVLPLPELDAPGPTRYDFAAWLALADLYERLGQPANAERIYEAIRALDPYGSVSG